MFRDGDARGGAVDERLAAGQRTPRVQVGRSEPASICTSSTAKISFFDFANHLLQPFDTETHSPAQVGLLLSTSLSRCFFVMLAAGSMAFGMVGVTALYLTDLCLLHRISLFTTRFQLIRKENIEHTSK